jgi:hypothetical protein
MAVASGSPVLPPTPATLPAFFVFFIGGFSGGVLMKLGEILRKSGGAFRAPTKPVKFKVIGRDPSSGDQTVADAEAVLVFVDESEREEALIESEKYIRKKFPDGVMLSADRLTDSHTYHLLAKALRDADDPRQPFAAGGVSELRASLHRNEAQHVYSEYLRFVDEEFPEHVDDETFEELADAAAKKSLRDLLSSFDLSTIRRALPSLVARFSKSTTPTSSDGRHGE